jgi:hypothetical protein
MKDIVTVDEINAAGDKLAKIINEAFPNGLDANANVYAMIGIAVSTATKTAGNVQEFDERAAALMEFFLDTIANCREDKFEAPIATPATRTTTFH